MWCKTMKPFGLPPSLSTPLRHLLFCFPIHYLALVNVKEKITHTHALTHSHTRTHVLTHARACWEKATGNGWASKASSSSSKKKESSNLCGKQRHLCIMKKKPQNKFELIRYTTPAFTHKHTHTHTLLFTTEHLGQELEKLLETKSDIKYNKEFS